MERVHFRWQHVRDAVALDTGFVVEPSTLVRALPITRQSIVKSRGLAIGSARDPERKDDHAQKLFQNGHPTLTLLPALSSAAVARETQDSLYAVVDIRLTSA